MPIPTVAEHFGGVQIVVERTFFKQLNKNGVENGVENAAQKKKLERYNSIIALIKENTFITADQMSERLNVVPRTIQRYLAEMQKKGILIREGDKNGGRWIVISGGK